MSISRKGKSHKHASHKRAREQERVLRLKQEMSATRRQIKDIKKSLKSVEGEEKRVERAVRRESKSVKNIGGSHHWSKI